MTRLCHLLCLPFLKNLYLKGEKTQAFFLDPDRHLIEIWQAQGK